MKVYWTDNDIDHLKGIQSYYSQNSPEYAKRIVDRLTNRSEQISDFPMSGREVAEIEMEQIREVFEGPYRIIYYIKPEQIDILAHCCPVNFFLKSV